MEKSDSTLTVHDFPGRRSAAFTVERPTSIPQLDGGWPWHAGQTGVSHTIDASIIDRAAPDLERMACLLEAAGDFRILRRLNPSWIGTAPCRSAPFGIFLDVETTGLDPSNDTVIELAMLPFDYTMDGKILTVGEPFVRLRNPGLPIPAAVTALTGITDEMVVDASIDPEEVMSFVEAASIITAHNAKFDRPFCENLWPVFASKPWGCSYREIAWADEGFEGAKLCHLAAGHGFFFDGHRAADDCRAGVEILARKLPRSGQTGLAALLESARRPRFRVRATKAPYVLRSLLKSKGYRWNDGDDGHARAWFIDVEVANLEAEFSFLRREVYGRDDIHIDAQKITAWDRYSERC
ncbi:3'-5' exonuclease [Bradyrhizobium sp. AUGA SZCCT0177]|uniref:3'-5' exonuclease n=1 Tax=Bradyrhizobium sp. AUGA SZCCT0177 TaxID=2807665 RepID=UPI001BAC1463|nr:3'-5' exonuclease [Bradyrhizobium sp. AUGA SZCCT0177]MBR1281310.1 3'-5' exonuclease [Bradyrhizobium sp. AUGA SZCCT0177]